MNTNARVKMMKQSVATHPQLFSVKNTGKAINNKKLPVSCRYAQIKMDQDFILGVI